MYSFFCKEYKHVFYLITAAMHTSFELVHTHHTAPIRSVCRQEWLLLLIPSSISFLSKYWCLSFKTSHPWTSPAACARSPLSSYLSGRAQHDFLWHAELQKGNLLGLAWSCCYVPDKMVRPILHIETPLVLVSYLFLISCYFQFQHPTK
jgi:hypothetical protein